jgi:outer membrane receptor for ferrienterochelin and colicin
MRSTFHRWCIVLGLIVWLQAPAPVVAQATKGQIQGAVTGENGDPLAGVTVTARGAALQGERAVISGNKGKFMLAGLPTGIYRLEFGLTGYQRVELEQVRVLLGKIVNVEAKLGEGELTEIVVVTARHPLLQTKTADVSLNLTAEEIDTLPAPERSFVDLARYTPSITGTEFNSSNPLAGGPVPSIRGEGQYGDNYLVDGLSVRDPSVKTLGTPLNYDAIEETQIITDGFSPEYSGALGGTLNAITKSGSNEFGGELAILYRDEGTTASFDETLLGTPDGFERGNAYINVGGPFLRDKLWYFGSYNRFDDTNEFAPAEISNFGTLPPGIEETTSDLFFGKLTWAAAPRHNVSLNYTYRDEETTGLGSARATPEARGGAEVQDDRLRLNYQAILSGNSLLEFRAGTVNREGQAIPQSGLGPARYEISDLGLVTNNSFGASTSEASREDAAVVYTHFFHPGGAAGTHELKAGVDYHTLDQDTGTFASGRNEDVFSIGVNPLASDFGQTDSFSDGASYRFITSGNIIIPLALNEFRTGGVLNNRSEEYGLFLQDRWELGNWNVLLGFRMDSQKGFNDKGDEFFSYNLGDAFAPRLSITHDLGGRGRNILKAGWGRFYDPTALRFGEFANAREILAFRTYDWVGGVGEDFRLHIDDGGIFDIHEVTNWSLTGEQSGEATPVDYSPVSHPPFVERWLVEYNRRLGNNYVLKARYVDGQTRQLIDDVHTNLLNFQMQNTDLKRRDYQALELEFNGNPSPNISFNASWVHAKSEGTNPGQFELGSFLSDGGSLNNFGIYLDRPPAEDPDFWCTIFQNPTCAPDTPGFFGFPGTTDDPATAVFEPALSDFNNDDVADQQDFELFWQNLWGGLGGIDGDDGWYGDLPYSVDDLFRAHARFTFPKLADTYLTLYTQWNSGYHWQRHGFQPLYQQFGHYSEDVRVFEYQTTDPSGECQSFADCTTVATVTPVLGQDFGLEQGSARGTEQTEDFWLLDLSIGKVFHFGRRYGFELRGELFNLFDEQAVLAHQNRATENFGVPLVRQRPRSFRLFARFSF